MVLFIGLGFFVRLLRRSFIVVESFFVGVSAKVQICYRFQSKWNRVFVSFSPCFRFFFGYFWKTTAKYTAMYLKGFKNATITLSLEFNIEKDL